MLSEARDSGVVGNGGEKLKGSWKRVSPEVGVLVKVEVRHRFGGAKGWPSCFARSVSSVGKSSP